MDAWSLKLGKSRSRRCRSRSEGAKEGGSHRLRICRRKEQLVWRAQECQIQVGAGGLVLFIRSVLNNKQASKGFNQLGR